MLATRNPFLLNFAAGAFLLGPQVILGQHTHVEAAKPQVCLSPDNVLFAAKDNPTCTQLMDESRIHTPKLIHATDPRLPHGDRISGTCMLSIVVGIDGKPSNITVKRSLRPDYDEKAIEAIHKFRFSPATLDGKELKVQINIEVNFNFQ